MSVTVNRAGLSRDAYKGAATTLCWGGAEEEEFRAYAIYPTPNNAINTGITNNFRFIPTSVQMMTVLPIKLFLAYS